MVSNTGPAWRALHPASVLVNLIPQLWLLVRSLWPLLIAMFFGNRMQGDLTSLLVDLPIVVFFLIMAAGRTLIHWATLRYRLHEGRLEVRTGLINRQQRVISPDRIQNIETVRNVFHTLSGLVEVRIETASGTEVEGMLSALSVDDANELVTALQAQRRRTATTELDAEPEPVLTLEPLDLLWHGVTSVRFGAVIVGMGLVFQLLQWSIGDPVKALGSTTNMAIVTGLLLVATATGGWILGLSRSFLTYWSFAMYDDGEELRTAAGLLTRRTVALQRDKVQLVSVDQPWLQRLAGFASLRVETAALRDQQDGTQQAEAHVPVVWDDLLPELVARALPVGVLDLDALPWRPPHPYAVRRALLASVVRWLILTAGLFWWLGAPGLLALLLIAPAAYITVLDHRYQGWIVTERLVLARRGILQRKTHILDRSKLQSTRVSAGPILRRLGLALITVRVAGSAIALPVIGYAEAAALQRALRPASATPRSPIGP